MAGWEQGMVGNARIPSSAAYPDGETTGYGGGKKRKEWVKERSTAWWEYHDSDKCSDDEFRKSFRMSKATFNIICDELDSVIKRESTVLRKPISVHKRVAICIYRLATGETLQKVSELFGCGASTCHKAIFEVCDAIKNVLLPKYIHWPNQDRLQEIKTTFGSIYGIPNVVGLIYTTHISMIAPKTNQEVYYNIKHTERNQKSSYSITIQGIVDPRGMFTDVCIGSPGSWSNEEVLDRSSFFLRFNMGMLENARVVGNSGYPLKDWLLVPYTDVLTWSQSVFNQKLGEIQMIANDAFMRLKGRWSFLQKRIETKLEDLPMVLGACCVLHNICEIYNEEMDVDLRFNFYDDEIKMDCKGSTSMSETRDTIAHDLLYGLYGNLGN